MIQPVDTSSLEGFIETLSELDLTLRGEQGWILFGKYLKFLNEDYMGLIHKTNQEISEQEGKDSLEVERLRMLRGRIVQGFESLYGKIAKNTPASFTIRYNKGFNKLERQYYRARDCLENGSKKGFYLKEEPRDTSFMFN